LSTVEIYAAVNSNLLAPHFSAVINRWQGSRQPGEHLAEARC